MKWAKAAGSSRSALGSRRPSRRCRPRATKAAVAGHTERLARDLGPRKITVNIVQPGPVSRH